MQKHAFERRPQQPVRTFAVEGKVAVLVVSDERKALRKRMHANLVRPSGFQFGIKISHRTETLEHRKNRMRRHSFRRSAHSALS